MKYLFADFKWEIKENYDFLAKAGKDYLACFDDADFTISVSESDLEYELSVSEFPFKPSYLEYVSVLRKIGDILPLHNGFILHSACFDVDGVGVAFLAPSGTGKTTHLIRWSDYLKDRLTIVNGDKPIVRFLGGEPFAYGSAWCGKEKLGSNTKTPLRHICFIERSETNFTEKISKEQAVNRILNQVYIPRSNPESTLKAMELIDKLLLKTQAWIIHCNMDDNAGEIAFNSIFK